MSAGAAKGTASASGTVAQVTDLVTNTERLTKVGMDVGGAILILILGWILAGIIRGVVRKALARSKMDPSLIGFISGMVYALIIIFAFVAMLEAFGVQTASFVAVLGAASFAVGFALQGSLANFASGVMLLVFRPFRVGDYIEAAGVAGTVNIIELFNTVLNTPDNVRIVVPNSKVYGDIIKNYSTNDTRRVDLTVGIGYGSSIEKAMEITLRTIKADSRILSEPQPTLAVSDLADSSVNLVVRVWVNKADYWDVRFDLLRAIKENYDKEGIEIPFPQQVVHHIGSAS